MVLSAFRTLVVVPLAAGIALGAALSLGACSEKIVEQEAPLGGSCLACHDGITNIHPDFALSCVDCHGGNDKVPVEAVVNIRDAKVMAQSHVLPKDPEMWWPNGIDDNNDGRVDEPGEFFDGRVIDEDGNAGLSEGRLAKRDQQDSEMNKDLNYLRFLNPGDLRAAQVSCGSRNKQSNAAMVCHAEIVYDARRSIMALHDAVPTGAAYGNAQLPRALDFGDAFAASEAGQRFDARNPRIGRIGYTFDYGAIDGSYSPETNQFDREALLELAALNIDAEDDLFEATAAPLVDDGTDKWDAKKGPGFTRTGQALKFYNASDFTDNRAIEVVQYIPSSKNRTFPLQGSGLELRVQKVLEGLGIARQSPIRNVFDDQPITNPVDAALRNFRAYHSLNFWAPNDNFGFVDFTTSPNEDDARPRDPSDEELRNNNNPFGRSRPSGCSACHIEYGKNGHNEELIDRTVADNGRQLSTDLPFGARADLGQRGYARKHELKTAVTLETCGSCHGFVTRVDYALTGVFEFETDFTNLEKIGTIGPIRYTAPNKNGAETCVQIFDNLAHYKNGVLLNAGEGVTEDTNNNGVLDAGEDTNGNGCLDIPDRVQRSESFDGRQSRIVYGGYNGAIRLQDVHVEKGMACTDCHYVWDVHGDSNMYSRNWDAVAIECDDCHGTPYGPAGLITTGPNGGDKMDDPKFKTPFGKPWFERKDGKLVQHSRTKEGLSWVVPELNNPKDGASAYAHGQPYETGPNPGRDNEARIYAHIQEPGKPGGLECYSCHSSWQPNCLTCHLKMDVAKPKQEIWFGDDDTEDIFFQLFSFTRSPFYMGRAGDVEGNKIAPHRSTMQVQLTIVAGGANIVDSAGFSTQNNLSSMVSNPYFPHTVRTAETKSCARCHTLKDADGNISNEHLVSEATGAGTGRYDNLGDWAIVATNSGMQQVDLKKEAAGNVTFPGFDFDASNVRQAFFPAGQTFDVDLVRGVSFNNGSGDVADVALVAHAAGVSVIDVTGRDNVGLPPTEIVRIDGLGAVLSVDHVDAAASQSTRFIALTPEELAVVDFRPALELGTVSPLIDADAGQEGDDAGVLEDGGPDALAQGAVLITVGGGTCALPNIENTTGENGCTLAHGLDRPTRVRLHGRFALVTHARGLSIFAIDEDPDRTAEVDPGAALAELVTFATDRPALDVVSIGRHAFVATGDGGVVIFDIGPIVYSGVSPEDFNDPLAPLATALVDNDEEPDSRGLALFGSRLLVADGKNGLRILDVSTAGRPVLEQTVRTVGGGQPDIDQATAVVTAALPTRNFAVIADGTNGVRAVNITAATDFREQLSAAAPAGAHDATRGFRLSMDRQDPLTPYDPKNSTRQVFTFPTNGSAVALARGFMLDSLADANGRRLRDGWSIGSTSLEEETTVRMRQVIVKEVPGTVDIRGDGLGCVVREGDESSVQFDPEDPNRCLPPVPGG